MKILYIAGIVSMMAFPAFAEKTQMVIDTKPEKVEMMPVAECKNIIRSVTAEQLSGAKPFVKPGVKPIKKVVKTQGEVYAQTTNVKKVK